MCFPEDVSLVCVLSFEEFITLGVVWLWREATVLQSGNLIFFVSKTVPPGTMNMSEWRWQEK